MNNHTHRIKWPFTPLLYKYLAFPGVNTQNSEQHLLSVHNRYTFLNLLIFWPKKRPCVIVQSDSCGEDALCHGDTVHLLPVRKKSHRDKKFRILWDPVYLLWANEWVCNPRGKTVYLWDQTASCSSMDSRAFHHAETQSAEKQSANNFLFLFFSCFALSYLGMLSSRELSVTFLTLQTQRVVVPS